MDVGGWGFQDIVPMFHARFRSWLMRVRLGVALVTCWAAGCDRGSAPEVGAAGANGSIRVVSLAPALTQMIVDLGKQDVLVGTAREDLAAPKGLPVVGDYLNIDTEALAVLQPTHVVMMVGKDGVPPHLVRLADLYGFALVAYPSPLSIEAVCGILSDKGAPGEGNGEGTPSLGRVLGVPGEARTLREGIERRLAALSEAVAGAPKRSVLMVIGTHPIVASGPGTVHDQLLNLMGGRNAASEAAVGAPSYDQERLIRLDPEVILLLSPGAPPLEAVGVDPRLSDLRGLPIRAVVQERIVLIDDPLVLLPSSSLVRVGVAMANAIHPELADRIDRAAALP